LLLVAAAPAQSLELLHWWKSASERTAAGILAGQIRNANIDWIDEDAGAAVSAAGASTVLRSRILSGDIPDVVQASSVTARTWATLGLAVDLDAVAAAGKWDAVLLPAVSRLIRPAGHVLAAPLGIHRVNTMFYNRRVFARLGLAPPTTWSEFERVATRLQRAGVIPLAQSSEPWQLALLFETLLLADADVELHRRLFEQEDAAAFSDARVGAALRHLRRMKTWMRLPVSGLGWTQVARQLADGSAAMLVAGDWVKGELNAAGAAADQAFGCMAAPGTARIHVYDLDTLAMLRSRRAPRAAQEKVAAIVVTPAFQERYNRVKGSVSVLRGANPAAMDSCARASWHMFADPKAVLVPSMVVGLTSGSLLSEPLSAELHRFFMDDAVSVLDTQRRLAAISRAFTKTRLP
jgi:glucose/mannose transport system substrate-binding protein